MKMDERIHAYTLFSPSHGPHLVKKRGGSECLEKKDHEQASEASAAKNAPGQIF